MPTRSLALASLALLVFTLPAFAFADPAGTANGSACATTSGGPLDGLLLDGNCVSTDSYPTTQTTVTPPTTQTTLTPPAPSIGLINPLKSGTSLESFLGSILDFVIRIGTVVVILMLVFVGFKFVTAQGNETKVSEAKAMLLWTVIGSLILLGAKAIQLGITATVQSLGG